jgi:zinc and cadmium transporter
MELLYIIIATLIISLISFSGAILFVFNEKRVSRFLILFVALAAGTMLGTALFDLLPESIEGFNNVQEEHEVELESDAHDEFGHAENTDLEHEHHSELFLPSIFILFGIMFFYVIEKFIHWHHHHDLDCHKHSLSTLSLVGDGVHNLLDGMLIAASFLIDVNVGIAVTLAIALHEIPQEIGDLSILLHSGFSKGKALIWNFSSGAVSILGGVLTYYIGSSFLEYTYVLTSFAAGAFLYIALADIIPELNKKHSQSQIRITSLFLVGLAISFGMSLIGHAH